MKTKKSVEGPMTRERSAREMTQQLSPLDNLLEDISVMSSGMWDNSLSDHPDLKEWHAVCNSEGIIAYFGRESDAYRFRLDYINRILNP